MRNILTMQRYAIMALLLTTAATAKRTKRSNPTNPQTTILTPDTIPPNCDLSCFNDGYCTYIEYYDYPISGKFGFYQACACPPGYHGGQCELIKEECSSPDYTCTNGAPCKEHNGEYVCDCSFADEMSLDAGSMCRDSIMTRCETREEGVQSFCMNGGACLSSNRNEFENLIFNTPTTHEGCKCPPEFEGPHCERLKNQPISTLIGTENPAADLSSSSHAKTSASVSITLCILIVGAALFARRRRRQRKFRDGSEKMFHSVYVDNLARDLGNLGNEKDESDDEGSLEEVEFNRDNRSGALASIEDGVDAEYL